MQSAVYLYSANRTLSNLFDKNCQMRGAGERRTDCKEQETETEKGLEPKRRTTNDPKNRARLAHLVLLARGTGARHEKGQLLDSNHIQDDRWIFRPKNV